MTRRRSYGRSTYMETGLGSILKVRGDKVRLARDDVLQSSLDLQAPQELDFEYMQHMDMFFDAMAAASHWDGPIAAFHGGAGALALPLAWNASHSSLTQVAVDIDEDLVREVRRVLDLDNKARINLQVGDAERILLGSGATYNVIVRDAFAGDDTPLHLQARTFHELVASRLRPGGIYLVNVGHDSEKSGEADVAGIVALFQNVVVVADPAVWHRGRMGNLTVAAWNGVGPDLDDLDRELRSLPLVWRLYRQAAVKKWVGSTPPLTALDPSGSSETPSA